MEPPEPIATQRGADECCLASYADPMNSTGGGVRRLSRFLSVPGGYAFAGAPSPFDMTIREDLHS
jgi:hypothetical protein